MMAASLLSQGDLAGSKQHFDAATSALDEDHPHRTALGSDLSVFTHAWSSHALWLFGDDREAVSRAEYAIGLARRREHLYSETLAVAYAALLHQMRLDTEQTLASAEAVVELCDRYGFGYYRDWASVLVGWARGQHEPEKGVAEIEAALGRLDANRAYARRPYYLSLLAQTYSRLRNRDRTASILDGAIAMADERGDLWWLPALYLQKSEVESGSEREAALQRALTLARSQQSRALEQRILASSASTMK
jgi:hypothetical protein